MFHFFLVIHCLLCVTLVILVLLQQGKGADMGAALGGSSSTVFGAGGATDFFTKLTTSVAVAFMVTSIALVRLYSGQSGLPTAVSDPLQGSVMQGAAVKRDAAPEQPVAAQPETPPAAEAKVDAPAAEAPKVEVKNEKVAEVAKPTVKKTEKKVAATAKTEKKK